MSDSHSFSRLVDRDGGLEGERGRAARILLYLMERDAAVGLLRGGCAPSSSRLCVFA